MKAEFFEHWLALGTEMSPTTQSCKLLCDSSWEAHPASKSFVMRKTFARTCLCGHSLLHLHVKETWVLEILSWEHRLVPGLFSFWGFCLCCYFPVPVVRERKRKEKSLIPLPGFQDPFNHSQSYLLNVSHTDPLVVPVITKQKSPSQNTLCTFKHFVHISLFTFLLGWTNSTSNATSTRRVYWPFAAPWALFPAYSGDYLPTNFHT